MIVADRADLADSADWITTHLLAFRRLSRRLPGLGVHQKNPPNPPDPRFPFYLDGGPIALSRDDGDYSTTRLRRFARNDVLVRLEPAGISRDAYRVETIPGTEFSDRIRQIVPHRRG